MSKIVLAIWVCLVFNISFSQKINHQNLSQEIFELNNEKRFEESITKLEDIINGNYTNYDKYHAYLQKSFTYKRLYNYSEALDNLDYALSIGLKTDRKQEVESRVLIEKLFIAFDLQEMDEVDEYLAQINQAHLNTLNPSTYGTYISLLGVMEMKKGNYQEADEKLNQAIRLMKKTSPQDLPNIYRKKVGLYDLMKQPKMALEAYDSGMYYANKYNMDLYKIIMYETMTQYYISNEDYKKALEFQMKVSEARTAYNHVNQTGKLNILEKQLLHNRKDLEIEYERKIRNVWILLSFILLILIVVLGLLIKVNRQRRILTEIDNNRMRAQLERLSRETNEKGEEKLQVGQYDLTPRQQEIIRLVKQGYTNKQIGEKLFISENTVKYHLKIIYNSLRIESRVELK